VGCDRPSPVQRISFASSTRDLYRSNETVTEAITATGADIRHGGPEAQAELVLLQRHAVS
jgi:hypothetical protein